MSNVKWIKVTTGLFDNRKIRQIECLPDGDRIIVIWLKILCLAGDVNDNGTVYLTKEIPYTAEMLAQQFNRPLPLVKLALRTFESYGMIEIIDDILHVSNWEKYQNTQGLERIKEQTRERVQRHREKQKQIECKENDVTQCNVTVTQNVTQCNATDKEKEIEKEYINTMCKKDAFALFERLWKLYPNKRGKGQVSEAKKRHLLDIGFEEMERAINRYKADLDKDTWRKAQNGSTFFTSGYVDYLDEEWYKTHPQEQEPQEEQEEPIEEMSDEEWEQHMEELARKGKL